MPKQILTLSLLFVSLSLIGQNGFVKNIDLGTNETEVARDIHVLDDGLLIIGRASINDSVSLFIMKTDFNGEELWRKIYPGLFGDVQRIFIHDSHIYMSGYHIIDNDYLDQTGFQLFRFNLKGELLENKIYSVYDIENPPIDTIFSYASSGPIVYDDKIVVYGQCYELQTDTAKFFSRGLLVWYNMDLSLDTMVFVQPIHRELGIWDSQIDSDGLLTILVTEDRPTTDPLQFEDNFRYFLKFDKEGNRVFTSEAIKVSHNRRILLSSTTLSNGDMLMYHEDEDNSKIVTSFSKNGSVNWSHQIDPNQNWDERLFLDITQAHDGNILLAGEYSDLVQERRGAYLCKLDSDTGELIWERVFLDWYYPLTSYNQTYGSNHALIWDVQVASDGTIYGVGQRQNQPDGNPLTNDIFLVKLDKKGCVEADCGGFEQDVNEVPHYKNMFYFLSGWYYQDPEAQEGIIRHAYRTASLNRKHHFELNKQDFDLDPTGSVHGFRDIEFFFLSELGDQIYHLVDNDTLLLYDFDLEVGDYFESDYTPHTLEVIDIDTIRLLNEDYRKTWTLADPNHPELTLT